MSNKILDKFNIKIPKDISVIYSEKKRILTFIGPLKRKSINLKLKIFIDKTKKIISISPLLFSKISNKEKKNMKSLRNTTKAQLEHKLIESSITLHQKLKINGVSYRAFFDEMFAEKLLTLKLGYSHLIFINPPQNLSIKSLAKTKLCIFGNSYNEVAHLSSLIRSKKTPEPYKGKGVLYENEIVELKEGKKI